MSDSESKLIAVVLERRPCDHPWLDCEWVVTGLGDGLGERSAWRLIREEGDMRRYCSPACSLTLHAADTEGYVYNLGSPRPSIFVVLRDDEVEEGAEVPFNVLLVTVSAYEAQDYLDSSEEKVERIALEGELRDWVEQFVAAYHRQEEFKKRRRDRLRVEEHKFGHEPLVELRRRGLREDGGDEL